MSDKKAKRLKRTVNGKDMHEALRRTSSYMRELDVRESDHPWAIVLGRIIFRSRDVCQELMVAGDLGDVWGYFSAFPTWNVALSGGKNGCKEHEACFKMFRYNAS
jgi:hypothetical protein